MAIRFDNAADALTRATDLPPITSFTIMAWVQIAVDTNTFAPFFTLGVNDTNFNFYTIGGDFADGTTLAIYDVNAGTFATGAALTVGAWYHVALVVSGTGAGQVFGYLNGALNITTNGASSVVLAPGTLQLANHPSETTQFLNGRLAAVKVYDVALSAPDIAQEMRQYVPIRTANLNSDYRFLNAGDLGDSSGNARVLTVAGTLTTEDGPPIPWRVTAPLVVTSAPSGGANYTLTADAGSYALTSTAAGLRVGRRLTTSSYAAQVIADGAVGYWRLGESSGSVAVDSAPIPHHGTYSGGVTLAQAGAISDGSTAALLNGTSGKMVYAGAELMPGGTAITLEAWVNHDGVAWGTYEVVTGALGAQRYLAVDTGSGVTFSLHISTGGAAATQRFFGTGYKPAITGWHHLVGTWTSGGGMRVYVDGVLRATSAAETGVLATTANVQIGEAAALYYRGFVDEVAIYPTALTATQIAAHYALANTSGLYAQTGTAAAIRVARRLIAAPGAHTQTGTALALRATRSLQAGSGSYAVTGTAAMLRAARRLVAQPGASLQTWTPATLIYAPATAAYALTADPGAYQQTGTSAVLRVGHQLAAGAGSYIHTGTASALRAARRLEAAGGSYAVAGPAGILRAGRRLGASPGSFVQTGSPAHLRAAWALRAAPGAYLQAGTDAGLTWSGALVVLASPAYVIHVRADVGTIRVRPDVVTIRERPDPEVIQ